MTKKKLCPFWEGLVVTQIDGMGSELSLYLHADSNLLPSKCLCDICNDLFFFCDLYLIRGSIVIVEILLRRTHKKIIQTSWGFDHSFPFLCSVLHLIHPSFCIYVVLTLHSNQNKYSSHFAATFYHFSEENAIFLWGFCCCFKQLPITFY